MKLVKVDVVPERTYRCRKSVKQYLDEFIRMNTPIVRVDPDDGEYNTVYSCYTSLYGAIDRHNYPIDVQLSDGAVYLIRRKYNEYA